MTEKTEKKCCRCEHAQLHALPGTVQRVLVCVGAPPTAILRPDGISSMFPPVNPEWFCGFFLPLPHDAQDADAGVSLKLVKP